MFQIRTIHENDASVVCGLSAQLGYTLSEQQTAANIRTILADRSHLALVATNDHKTIGWIHAFRTTTIESLPFIELAGLVVDEQYRNKGIGQLLVSSVKDWCFRQEVLILRVRSNVIRNDAHRFYTNQGFTELKQQKVFQLNLK